MKDHKLYSIVIEVLLNFTGHVVERRIPYPISTQVLNNAPVIYDTDSLEYKYIKGILNLLRNHGTSTEWHDGVDIATLCGGYIGTRLLLVYISL